MKADLHVHTDVSDCSDSPEQVFHSAKMSGVELIAITDHDTLEGRETNAALAEKYGIGYVPGIEVSAYDYGRGRPCHLIGLHVGIGCSALDCMIRDITKERQTNSLKQIDRLAELGFDVSPEDFTMLRSGRTIYKQHIMEVLIKKGVANDFFGDFYQCMFKNGGPLQLNIAYPSHVDAVDALVQAGAMPVLAHPTLYGNLDAVHELKEIGLAGIEMNYPKVTKAEQAVIQDLAKQYSLLLSGGSDFHGRYAGHSEGQVGSCCVDWKG